MTWGSPRCHTQAWAAARVLLLLAASCAILPSALPGHALAVANPVCLAPCESDSAPSPSPAPVHDESDCPRCKAAGAVVPALQVAGLALPLHLTTLPGDWKIVPPRALQASPEAARAPPRALFV